MIAVIAVTSASFAIIGILVGLFYLHRKRCHTYLKKLAVPGPAPNFLFGNLHEFKSRLMVDVLKGWTAEYGKIFGYYEGSTPVVVVADPDTVHDILVKKFNCFNGKKDFSWLPDPDEHVETNIFLARGIRWKRLRSICNPSFSSARMKQMKPLMDKCIDTLVDVLQKKADSGEMFDIYAYLQGLTLDVIAETAFGIETNAQTDPNDPFLQKCRRFFNGVNLVNGSFLLVASLVFPELRTLWLNVYDGMQKVKDSDTRCLNSYSEEIIELRKSGHINRCDLLQLLLDAQGENVTDDKTSGQNRSMGVTGNEVAEKGTKLTKEELISQCILFLVAGYETTSTSLGFAVDLLAKHPEVQRKLQEEIDQFVPDPSGTPSYDDIQKMTYLDMVICEVLRLYPVAGLVVFRRCMESCTVGNGLYLPEGTSILVNVWSLHLDPDLWGPVDPKSFYPERFSAEEKNNRHPMAWLPFGGGPRYCLGMRFALLESKLALIKVLRKFRISTCEKTEYPLQVKEGVTVTPKNGCYVRLIERESSSTQ